MINKLEQIKMQLAAMDAAWEAVNANNDSETRERMQIAQDAVRLNLAEKLHMLLDVVEATAAIGWGAYQQPSEMDGSLRCVICGGDWSRNDHPQHEPDCFVLAQSKALAALEDSP